MKIGFDVSDLSTNRADGTTRYTAELAKRLPLLAPQDQWYFFAPFNFAHSSMTSKFRSAQGKSLPSNVEKHISPWPKYWTQFRLPFDLYRYKPDVLFMPIQQLPYLRPKIKTVAVIHDLAFHIYPEQFTYKDWLLLHIFTAYVASHADHVIAVSESTAKDIAHYYGRAENVRVIHHGVDHEKFYIPSEEEKREAWQKLTSTYPKLRKPYILYIGQIQPRKNLIRLIETFEQLQTNQPDLQLVIAGSHGWLHKPIFDRVRRSKAKDHIHMLGRVPDNLLPSLYWHAEVFVLPSLYEGFGMPILEAMASGCPVVTSNVSSMPEIAGNAAILVDPKDTESIANGIKQVVNTRDSLIQKGIEQAKRFTWQKTAQETLNILSL